MKYFIITFGCQMNKSDSERIAAVLENISYQPASKIDEADLILVNMCSVRQSAVDRVYGLVQRLKKLREKNPKLRTILTGCILKEDKKKFAQRFDLILNIKNLPTWPKILKRNAEVKLSPERENYLSCSYLEIRPKYQNNFSAFVPISNGCNFNCTYCVIPSTRGKLICRNHTEVLKEVQEVIKKGFKEIWLLGQNVNDYSSPIDPAINFAKLLKIVNEIKGDFWIRFTSPNPANFSDELIEIIAKCQKVTPYLNLPVQSGDDRILKKMNRSYLIKQYKNLIKKIRKAFKKYRQGLEREVAISTDIIIGFPGETKKQFENTIKIFKKIKFDMAYIAKYSPRPGTVAAKFTDNVSPKEKEKRYQDLTKILKQIVLEKNKKYIGKEVKVLVNEKREDFFFAKTRTYKTAKFQRANTKYQALNNDLVGQFAKVKIFKASTFGLEGKLIV